MLNYSICQQAYTKLTTHHEDKDGNEIITTLSDIDGSLPADICLGEL